MTGNKYPGRCLYCGGDVAARAGVLLRNVQGLRYAVTHRPAVWAGSPVSGQWVGGCPERGQGRGAA